MEEINIKELWNYFLSKYFIVIITILICIVLGNIYLFYIQTPLYKSTTSLVLVSEENSNSTITQNDITLNNNLVSTYTEIIKSRAVLSEVIENLKLEENVEQLTKSINVSSTTNTQLIKVEVCRKDKKEARNIASEIASVFSTKIKDIYKIQNISIIDEAQLPKKPYNMNVIKQNIISVGIGCILSFGIVFMLFYFDTSIKDAKTIEEKLKLTVFGTVPKVGDKNGLL